VCCYGLYISMLDFAFRSESPNPLFKGALKSPFLRGI
jgi:hypothetical protein